MQKTHMSGKPKKNMARNTTKWSWSQGPENYQFSTRVGIGDIPMKFLFNPTENLYLILW